MQLHTMVYPNEFMKKRSFEVVWAVFRVAATISRVGVKQLLEDRALAYFTHKNIHTLESLEEAIDLGSKLKDISEVNASVLLREISSLRAALLELQNAPVEKSVEPEQESIEHIFSEPPMLFSDFTQMMRSQGGEVEVGSSAHATEVQQSPAKSPIESGKAESGNVQNNQQKTHLYTAPSFSGNNPAKSPIESGKAESGNNPANGMAQISGNQTIDKTVKPTTINVNSQGVLSSAERKERIVSILKSKNFCSINDIMNQLPKVSDRTLRYDVKTLVDSKIVERMGKGGPNSFFRLRKKGGDGNSE